MAGHAAQKTNQYDRVVAACVRILREQRSTVDVFAAELAGDLGWAQLSRQAIYDWEGCESRVPANVLLAGARRGGVPLDALVALALRRALPVVAVPRSGSSSRVD